MSCDAIKGVFQGESHVFTPRRVHDKSLPEQVSLL